MENEKIFKDVSLPHELNTQKPKDCTEEFDENICRDCPFLDFTMVSHPGGSNVHSVEYRWCTLDYWEDDF